jgi:DNA primase
LQEFLETELFPRLTPELIYTHPAHQWHRSPGKWRGGCPWHESRSGTSFYVSTDSLLWRCPACDIGGGPIQYLWRLKGHTGSPRGSDFIGLIKELCARVGIAFPERELSDEERETARKRDVRRAILAAVAEHAAGVLWSARGDAARTYLHERGFGDEAIRELELGLYPHPDEMVRTLHQAGFDRHDVAAAKVVRTDLQGYITFPWHDAGGRPLTICATWQNRTPPPGKPKKKADRHGLWGGREL